MGNEVLARGSMLLPQELLFACLLTLFFKKGYGIMLGYGQRGDSGV